MTGCRDCAKFKKEVANLKEELALLKLELNEFKSDFFKRRKKKKPPKEDPPEPEPKKKGGPFGHTGWFRKKPGRIDKIEEVRLKRCPVCGGKDLAECGGVEEHAQEDIVLPEVETTLFRKQRYYCKTCKRTVTGKGISELPGSRIGPLAKAWAVFLKFGVKISDRDTANILKMAGLEVVPSSIVGFRDQLKREAYPVYKQLIESLKRGRFAHWDETGTKIDGDNAWRWKVSNKVISVTHTDRGRGQKVVEEIFGSEYEGVLISDFLSAYNKIKAKGKQRCLVHILRDLKKVISYWSEDDEEVLRYCVRLKKIFEGAIKLYKEYTEKVWDKKYYRRRELITESLKDFAFPNPDKKILKRFAKRLNRHKDELFTFLYIKGIDYHNNHAEQQIRPDVLLRKVTFGNRSEKGARVHDIVMSILQTAKLNGLDPVETFQDILLPKRKNPLAGIIAQPP